MAKLTAEEKSWIRHDFEEWSGGMLPVIVEDSDELDDREYFGEGELRMPISNDIPDPELYVTHALSTTIVDPDDHANTKAVLDWLLHVADTGHWDVPAKRQPKFKGGWGGSHTAEGSTTTLQWEVSDDHGGIRSDGYWNGIFVAEIHQVRGDKYRASHLAACKDGLTQRTPFTDIPNKGRIGRPNDPAYFDDISEAQRAASRCPECSQVPCSGISEASVITIRAVVIRAISDMADYEKAADRVAEMTGGTAKVWGPDALLIEDAGPGIHVHWEFGGEAMEMWIGSAHPEQLIQWMEVRLQAATSDPEVLEMDLRKVASDPIIFAKFVTAVLHTQNVRAKAVHHKVQIAGRRDMIIATQLMLSERAREAIQMYFAETAPPPDAEVTEPPPTDPGAVPGSNGEPVDPEAPPQEATHTFEVGDGFHIPDGDEEAVDPESVGDDDEDAPAPPAAEEGDDDWDDGDELPVDDEEGGPDEEEEELPEDEEDPASEDEEEEPVDEEEPEEPEEGGEPVEEVDPDAEEEDPEAPPAEGVPPEEEDPDAAEPPPQDGDEGEEVVPEEDPEGVPEGGEEPPPNSKDTAKPPGEEGEGDDGTTEFDELLKEVGTEDEDPTAIEEPVFTSADQEDMGGGDGLEEDGVDDDEPEEGVDDVVSGPPLAYGSIAAIF